MGMMKNTQPSVSVNDSARDYLPFEEFVEAQGKMSYLALDAATAQDLNLFAIRENYDFEGLEITIRQIMNCLPAIKRIFAKPILRLKDTGEVLPIESVRVVNHRSVAHAASHSQLWENVTEQGMTPRKLLTVNHKDEYAIYENIVFTHLIDRILGVLSQNIRILRDMLYGHGDLRYNILDRENHLQYYIALGKLHIGYVKDYERYRPRAERCLARLTFIDEVIRSRLSSTVYQKCKGRKEKAPLQKTNIFRNQKDYYRIYSLHKWFGEHHGEITSRGDDTVSFSSDGYDYYCLMLTLFAAGHFNFRFDDRPIDFARPNLTASFGKWNLQIDRVSCPRHSALRLTVQKEVDYTVLLIPVLEAEDRLGAKQAILQSHHADDVQLLAPTEEEKDVVFCSVYDIESFRRIQQILLRAMIYADRTWENCPFCGALLVMGTDNGDHVSVCDHCRTQIALRRCPHTDGAWVETSIINHRPHPRESRESEKRDPILYKRYLESQMHFRNILPLGDGAKCICPQCGKQHQ